MCFIPGWLMFSLPSKRKQACVGPNTTSVELERKNLADLHCKYLRQQPTKKHPLPYIACNRHQHHRNVCICIHIFPLTLPAIALSKRFKKKPQKRVDAKRFSPPQFIIPQIRVCNITTTLSQRKNKIEEETPNDAV